MIRVSIHSEAGESVRPETPQFMNRLEISFRPSCPGDADGAGGERGNGDHLAAEFPVIRCPRGQGRQAQARKGLSLSFEIGPGRGFYLDFRISPQCLFMGWGENTSFEIKALRWISGGGDSVFLRVDRGILKKTSRKALTRGVVGG